MTVTDLAAFIRDRARHVTNGTDTSSLIEFGVPRMHYESQDTFSGTVSCCLDWRAEIHLSALDAHPEAPDVVAGFVEFLVLQLGEQPVAELLDLYGPKAAAFTELFEGPWLAPDLDEAEDFADGMPIHAVLLVLDAAADPSLEPRGRLRPWAVSQVAHTMLPTTAGVVAMHAVPSATPVPGGGRLVDANRLDPDGPRVGCVSIPGHPRFFGRATLFTYLDDARANLDAVRHETFHVAVQRP